MKLEVKNLTKYYKDTLGIKDVSFGIKNGEVFGFIGPNGAGKSTTIRSIMNLIDKSGVVLIDGKEFKKDDINLMKKISYLPSEINLYDDLTVREMLDYNEEFYPNSHSLRKKLVNRFRLDENKNIEDLSLGNLKKLGIVITFMKDAEIIILDEPTSGLDPIMQDEFYKLILEEKEKGKTILYSSHILSEVSKICDRIGVIKDGSIILIDKISKLSENNLNILSIVSKDKSKIIDKLNAEIIEEKDDYFRFKTKIQSDKLIKELSLFTIDKITIEEATLEDIVMEYYK